MLLTKQRSTIEQVIILLNDEFIDDRAASVPIWDAGLLYGYGVYESMRTFGGKFKLLGQHFKRLKQSAKALSIPPPLPEQELKSKLAELVRKRQGEDPNCDFRVRITLTAGTANLRTNTPGKPTLVITAAKLATTKTEPLILQSFHITRQLPTAKTTAMLPAILAQHNALKHGADEALLVDGHNNVHEGSFCNVYLIKNGVLKYPESSALKGVTQNLLLGLISGLIPVEQTILNLDDFYNADEVFTSGAVRGIVPVKQIDGNPITAPGPYTLQIQDIYNKWAKE